MMTFVSVALKRTVNIKACSSIKASKIQKVGWKLGKNRRNPTNPGVGSIRKAEEIAGEL